MLLLINFLPQGEHTRFFNEHSAEHEKSYTHEQSDIFTESRHQLGYRMYRAVNQILATLKKICLLSGELDRAQRKVKKVRWMKKQISCA